MKSIDELPTSRGIVRLPKFRGVGLLTASIGNNRALSLPESYLEKLLKGGLRQEKIYVLTGTDNEIICIPKRVYTNFLYSLSKGMKHDSDNLDFKHLYFLGIAQEEFEGVRKQKINRKKKYIILPEHFKNKNVVIGASYGNYFWVCKSGDYRHDQRLGILQHDLFDISKNLY
jgi:hypothetical protein